MTETRDVNVRSYDDQFGLISLQERAEGRQSLWVCFTGKRQLGSAATLIRNREKHHPSRKLVVSKIAKAEKGIRHM